MTPQLTEAFKKSLKSNRWNAIDLGAAANYTNDNMVARWITEKNQWLQVSWIFDSNVLVIQARPTVGGPAGEPDVRGNIQSGAIPQSESDATRMAVRRTMKQLSGPYSAFDKYYPLEDTIELYNEIWYESSSSDEE